MNTCQICKAALHFMQNLQHLIWQHVKVWPITSTITSRLIIINLKSKINMLSQIISTTHIPITIMLRMKVSIIIREHCLVQEPHCILWDLFLNIWWFNLTPYNYYPYTFLGFDNSTQQVVPNFDSQQNDPPTYQDNHSIHQDNHSMPPTERQLLEHVIGRHVTAQDNCSACKLRCLNTYLKNV